MDDVWRIADELHRGADLFYLGSVDGGGFPNVKTVYPAKFRESIREIYFSTNTSSLRVAEYRRNPKASVYYASCATFQGVMLVGFMEVLEEQGTKSRFWNEGDEQYYPLGETDPDYCILKFTPVRGRYYHNFRSEDFTV